jgi:hypothetical protein
MSKQLIFVLSFLATLALIALAAYAFREGKQVDLGDPQEPPPSTRRRPKQKQ